jgi:hypothetical protein
VDAKDPAFFSAFPDGRHFFMWQDRAKTLAEIANSRATTPRFIPPTKISSSGSPVVESLLLTTPPQFPPRGGDFIDYLKLAARLRGLEREGHRRAGENLHAKRRRFLWTSGSNRSRSR